MAGNKGEITRASGKKRQSVYLSDVFGIWPEGNHLHITMIKEGEQKLHTSITKNDGLLYDVMMMLYHHGLALNP